MSPERQKYHHEYWVKNHDKILRQRREYRKRPNVHEHILEVHRKFYYRHKKRIAEKARRYYETHKEQIRAYRQTYYSNPENREHKYELNRQRTERIRLEVFSHYSPNLVCQQCGFKDIRALTVDHIHGDGNQHRRSLFGYMAGGVRFYDWLRVNNYPEGFQILCVNCNWIKHLGGFC